MKEPLGEQVGLDFYFSDRSCADAMRDVVMHCLASGARCSGEVLTSEFPGARDSFFASAFDKSVSLRTISDQELTALLVDADVRLVRVGLWNAVGITEGVPEIVTFNGVLSGVSGNDNNPISIDAEGWRFSTPGYEVEAMRDARRCYRKFLNLCRHLQPDYAAILNEDSLLCRYDLKRGHGERCFGNFFVNQARYGAQVIDEIESMYPDAYTERSPAGLYVATWMFAPKRVVVDRSSALRRSKEVAQLLSRA